MKIDTIFLKPCALAKLMSDCSCDNVAQNSIVSSDPLCEAQLVKSNMTLDCDLSFYSQKWLGIVPE